VQLVAHVGVTGSAFFEVEVVFLVAQAGRGGGMFGPLGGSSRGHGFRPVGYVRLPASSGNKDRRRFQPVEPSGSSGMRARREGAPAAQVEDCSSPPRPPTGDIVNLALTGQHGQPERAAFRASRTVQTRNLPLLYDYRRLPPGSAPICPENSAS